jgi:hypothetical protein
MSARTAVIDVPRLDRESLRQLFLDARTHNGWLDHPVDDEVLRELGYGDPAGLFPRNPRLEFEEACRVV